MLGEGILKGLAATAKNFAGSFVSKERLTTVEYPEQRIPLPEASRNFPFLVYDGADWEAVRDRLARAATACGAEDFA